MDSPFKAIASKNIIKANFLFPHMINMVVSSQPQIFFDAGCLFADFAITVIFYPVIKLYESFCAYYMDQL